MIIKNSALNVLGQVIPTIVAVPVMGLMARLLEPEKFGLFMLAYSLVGYASLLDAGLTRAVIRAVAMNNGDRHADRLVVGSATWAVIFLSTLVSAIAFACTDQIVNFFNVSASSIPDTTNAFRWTAWIIPPFLVSLVWFSHLEGRQQFQKLSLYKTLNGVLVSLLPALMLLVETSLSAAVIGLLLARLIGLATAFIACRTELESNFFSFHSTTLRSLFRFGGWITVSNLISPLMAQADRFILSHVFGAQRVAYYVAPSDTVARLSIIPGAIARAIFPLLSKEQDQAQARIPGIYKIMLVTVCATVLPVFLFAAPLLDLWLGAEYGQESANILRVLLIGLVFNAIAQIPFARIQAKGNARLTALIHLFEVIPYLIVLGLLVSSFGMLGAAVTWTIRTFLDMVLLEYYSRRGAPA